MLQKMIGASTAKAVGVRSVIAFAFCLFAFGLSACDVSSDAAVRSGQQAGKQEAKKLSDLKILSSRGERMLKVELALTERQHAKGLMYRRSMPADQGMLFIYDAEREVNMWMKNTPLSLDMLFFKRDGRIVRIVRSTEPFSETIIPSGSPVLGVLEVNAGVTDRMGVEIGNRLVHPILSNDRRGDG